MADFRNAKSVVLALVTVHENQSCDTPGDLPGRISVASDLVRSFFGTVDAPSAFVFDFGLAGI